MGTNFFTNDNRKKSQEEFFKEVKKNIQEAKYDKEVEEHCFTFFNPMGLPIKQKSLWIGYRTK
ncbi:MAG: hypothetical protein J6T56_03570 [Bacteroidales bacterium]|nr:hypothetical protein [Bacteroidales bacterium]MBP5612553.1 hypothetical protein [Bacteroidales bacterium]